MKLFSSLKNTAQAYLGQYKQQDPATYAAAQQAVGGLLIIDGVFGIDNPLGRNRRPGILGTLGGILLGVVFMFVPLIVNNLTGLAKMTATTTATVVSVGDPVVSQSTSSTSQNSSGSSSCSLTTQYIVNGIEQTGTSAISSSGNCSKAVGSTLTINYDPANPSAWASDTETIGWFVNIFFYIGLLAVILSFFTFIIRLFSIIFGWKLLKSGRALAKSLPEGTNLATIVEEIRQRFKGSIMGTAAPVFQPGNSAPTSAAQQAPPIDPEPQPNPPTKPTNPF